MNTARTRGKSFILLMFAARAFAQDPALPFAFTTAERTDHLPVYVSPPAPNLYNSSPTMKVGWGIDSPTGFVVIDGETWVIFNSGNQYGTTVKVARFRGTDFDHTEREPDGVIEVEPGVSTHFCGGLWYDAGGGKLYAPIHCEYDRGISPPAGWTRKKTRLATSTDKGVTWRLEGDILTDCMPEKDDWLRFSGSYFEAGPADFDFYADEQGGYFYITSCNAYAPKNGTMNNFLWFNEVARCAIADRMAPGKWHKFSHGGWTEPGLGGKSSKVSMASYGIYGRVIYSRYLKTYLRIGVSLGVIDRRFTNMGLADGSIYISTCDDLSTQRWSPAAKLFDRPDNDKFGITLTGADAKSPFACEGSLRVYNYWLYNIPSRAIDVAFGPGATSSAGFPRYGSYAYEPLPESGDTIVSRRTKIVGCGSPGTAYGGAGWRTKKDPVYYMGEAKESDQPGASVQYSFDGSGIFWRAVAAPDGGRADIYIDGVLTGTVDCYYRDALPFQFAYIRTGLDPAVRHSFRAVIRNDANTRSGGRFIRHMAFEYTAESYRASAGFSSVGGKNNWYYGDLRFVDFTTAAGKRMFVNAWMDDDGCTVGDTFQVTASHPSVRSWISPHEGSVRIEGTVVAADERGEGAGASILRGNRALWSYHPGGPPGTRTHNFLTDVEKGDRIDFITEGGTGVHPVRAVWDPVITYESSHPGGKQD